MISMAVKSGTKRFHGSAWEYNRNDAFDAYYFLKKQQANPHKTGTSLQHVRIQPRRAGGVQVQQPQDFFFYNQEWRREINGGSIFNQVPTADVWLRLRHDCNQLS